MAILALLFFVTTAVCAIGWASMKLRFLAVVWYFIEKGTDPPSDTDMNRCLHLVAKQIIKDLTV